MKGLLWVFAIAMLAAVVWGLLRARRRMEDQKRAEEARAASFLAQAMHRPKDAPQGASPEEKLLFDAAAKAGEAGEPALCIQLYARIVARFPQSVLLAQVRDGIEAQKKKLATVKAPGTSAPG